MDQMYGMRCAAVALNWFLIGLNVLGAIMAALIVLQMKGVARWRIFRPLAAVFCRVCRVPYGATLGAISVDINKRYEGKETDALNYVDRVVDRQINKARGILPFNSVIITALSLNNRSQYGGAIKDILDYLSHTVIAALFISSLLLLELFWVQWGGKPGYYKEFAPEVTTGLKIARDRSIILDMSIILSVTAIICLLLGIIGLPVLRWFYAFANLAGSHKLCWLI